MIKSKNFQINKNVEVEKVKQVIEEKYGYLGKVRFIQEQKSGYEKYFLFDIFDNNDPNYGHFITYYNNYMIEMEERTLENFFKKRLLTREIVTLITCIKGNFDLTIENIKLHYELRKYYIKSENNWDYVIHNDIIEDIQEFIESDEYKKIYDYYNKVGEIMYMRWFCDNNNLICKGMYINKDNVNARLCEYCEYWNYKPEINESDDYTKSA